MDPSHACQNLTMPERELFLSNAWPSSTLELCTAYATIINIKSDADQPDAVQDRPHAIDNRLTDSHVSDVAYQCLQIMVRQYQLFNNNNKEQGPKTPRQQCFNIGSGNAWCAKEQFR